MTFSLLLNLAIALGYLALSREWPWLWPWAYGVLGLAVLAKGPVALVTGRPHLGPLQSFFYPHPSPPSSKGREQAEETSLGRFLKQPRLRAGSPWCSPGAGSSSAVLVLPWFAVVQWRYPEFLHYFIWEQHFCLFPTPTIHPEPLYYYGPRCSWGCCCPGPGCCPGPWAAGARGESPHCTPSRRFGLGWCWSSFHFPGASWRPYLPALLPLAVLLGKEPLPGPPA